MAVGPSAPPMMPIEADCAIEKPKTSICVTKKVAKMPS